MPRDRAYIFDILEAARLVTRYTSGKSHDDFLNDLQCQDAVVRRLEVIGEVARRISEETKKAHPSIPWKDMINMRNIMIHEYDNVDLEIVWDTIQNDLPKLIEMLETL